MFHHIQTIGCENLHKIRLGSTTPFLDERPKMFVSDTHVYHGGRNREHMDFRVLSGMPESREKEIASAC